MQSTTYFPVATVYVQTARATRAKNGGFKNLRFFGKALFFEIPQT
jgi:hypothetical protein